MKKSILLICLMLLGSVAHADFVQIDSDVNMANFWEKDGKDVQKVLNIGNKVVNANKLTKRISIILYSSPKTINAEAHYSDKSIYVYSGLLPYIDNDDELAAILSHEMVHCLDYYDGPLKWISMKFNPKTYETKADLLGIDMMTKAGYNPVAAITVMNKISGESVWDTWFLYSHPKGSTRLIDMYKYIYKKYPSALDSEMVKNVNYQNFVYAEQKEITEFQQKEKLRGYSAGEDL